MTPADFQSWAAARQSRIEAVLEQVLPPPRIAPARLHAAMRYAVLGAGKRVRPLLAFAAGELSGADIERVAIAGAAVELIHAYSLVHDDLPCMDDDVLRRGKPTCHVEYDEATALLVGDALQSLAFQLLAEYRLADDADDQLQMVKLLAAAAGSRGMAGGQAIDLDVGRQEADGARARAHAHPQDRGADPRVGAARRALRQRPRRQGARAGSTRSRSSIGLAFQVVDDVLDAEAPTATLGKTAGKDAERGQADLRERARARRVESLRRGAAPGGAESARGLRRARACGCASSPISSC